MTTAFLGLTHMGTVMSIAWADRFGEVTAVDPDPGRVARLRAGVPPLAEPGYEEHRLRAAGRLTVTDDPAALEEADLVFVTWDVETDLENRSLLTGLDRLLDLAIPRLRDGVTAVLMSQVPVGTTRALRERIASERPGLSFTLLYRVETLVIGEAFARFLHPEQCIVGKDAPGTPIPATLRRAWESFGCPVLEMSYESAEIAKMAINLYLAGSVTFSNTLSDLCEGVGADVRSVTDVLRRDRRIGPHAYLRPGLGIAGGNIERDLESLAAIARGGGLDTPYLDAIRAAAGDRIEWLFRTLEREMPKGIPDPRVAVWGLAYKPGTDSMRNAPALLLFEHLAGRVRFAAHDPGVRSVPGHPDLPVHGDPYDAAEGTDALVILTGWPEYRSVDGKTLVERMRRPVLVDCAGIVGQPEDLDTGIRYIGMGRGR